MLCDQSQCTVHSFGAYPSVCGTASDLPNLVGSHNQTEDHLLTTSSHHMVSAQHYDALESALSHFLWWKFWNPWHWRCNELSLWTYGLNNPNYVHKAQLTIPKSLSQPSMIVLLTPTLQDLLNPVSVDNVKFPPSASTEELYGTMFDDGDDNESLLITFFWGAHLKCLIEALIDLVNPKLIVQFKDASAVLAVTDHQQGGWCAVGIKGRFRLVNWKVWFYLLWTYLASHWVYLCPFTITYCSAARTLVLVSLILM